MSRLKIFAGCVIALAMSFLLAQAAFATTYYYIDADAGSGGDGSLNTPWDHPNDLETSYATITAAAASGPVVVYLDHQDSWTFSGNDRLELASHGTSWTNSVTYDGMSWTGDGSATNQLRAEIILDVDNNRGVWIQDGVGYGSGMGATYDAYVKVYGLDLNGFDKTSTSAILQTHNASHVIVESCVIHNAGNASATSSGVRFTTFYEDATTGLTITDLQVKNCTIYKTSTHPISIYPKDIVDVGDILVEGCSLSDYGSNFAAAAGIQVMSASSGTIRGNVIHNSASASNGAGIKLEERESAPTDILIESNTIYGSPGEETNYGIELNGTVDTVIRYNHIFNLSNRGIFIYGSSTGVELYRNIIFNTGSHAVAIGDAGSTVADMNENIIKQTTDQRAVSNSGTITSHANNIYYNPVATRQAVWDNNTSVTYANIVNWENTAINTEP